MAYYHAVWGRLGFFPASFDVRGVSAGQAAMVGAFYDPAEKTVTVFGEPQRETLVHEFVHALEDQTFDLQKYDRGATSSDEALARRAVVEGHATLCTMRFRNRELNSFGFLGMSEAQRESEAVLANTPLPPIFSEYS